VPLRDVPDGYARVHVKGVGWAYADMFTWRDPGGDAESVVTVELADLGDGRTAMTFHQAGFTTEEARGNVHDGWSSAFDRLAEHVTDPEKES
jgi:uncharacterized protein YndB with AHSA1/START domain